MFRWLYRMLWQRPTGTEPVYASFFIGTFALSNEQLPERKELDSAEEN